MSKSGRKNYDVGYRRPPRSGQFKKGQSGNPKGRRKGAKSLPDLFLKVLHENVTINENGAKRTIPKLEAVMKQLVNKAAGGDIKLVWEIREVVRQQERLAETEASYQEHSTAEERLTKKLDEMAERLRAGKPLFPEESEE
jgi:hypothetical protein